MNPLIISTLIFISIFVLISGCTSRNAGTDNVHYIVIEEVQQVNAKVIEGQLYNFTPPIIFMNDATPEPVFPDQPERYSITVNNSLSILYFSYYSLYGPYRNITSVQGIYGFPYQLKSGVTILGVDQNGTVRMCYGNDSFDLEPGVRGWSSPLVSSRIENVTGFDGKRVKVEYDTSWWIYTQPGWHGKSQANSH